MAHHVHADQGVESRIRKRERLLDVGLPENDYFRHSELAGQNFPRADPCLVDVDPRYAATDFAGQEQGRPAGTAADVQHVVGCAQT
jgi:hypothetical protein